MFLSRNMVSFAIVLFCLLVSEASVVDQRNAISEENSLDFTILEGQISTTTESEVRQYNPHSTTRVTCRNGGRLFNTVNGGIYCLCKNGTSGGLCEIVDECVQNPKKCGSGTDVQCGYDLVKGKAKCTCLNTTLSFDSYTKKCRVPCEKRKDCVMAELCIKNEDDDHRFCKCYFGYGGDKCSKKIDECKAIGRDCGTNPNVTCLQGREGVAVCYCPDWSEGFNYEDKDCRKCECEGNNLGCFFQPGGEKTCYCERNYYQQDEKCRECQCGYYSSGCESKNGTKVCNCWRLYKQNEGICEECNCGGNSINCEFVKGEKKCSCKEGYIQSDGICREDCTTVGVECRRGSKCVDRVCKCLQGTQGDRCEIIDDCASTRKKYDTCGYSEKVYCDYNVTTQKSFCRCSEVDELYNPYDKYCQTCNCGPGGVCSFDWEGRKCKCKEGYALDPYGWFNYAKCVPCECGEHSSGCKFETDDIKKCFCDKGYSQKDGKCEKCDCGQYGDCWWNDWGKKRCNCSEGFGDDDGYCKTCECGEHSSGCKFETDYTKICFCDIGYSHKDGKCEICYCGPYGDCWWNDWGEKKCNCTEGFGDDDGYCKSCKCYMDSDTISCTFSAGKQKCLCPEGFEERGFYCLDIDECENPFACPENSRCSNTKGSYTCTCNSGYRPSIDDFDPKVYGCVDIDECSENLRCQYRDSTNCVNTKGGYRCECKPGYHQDFSTYAIEFEGCKEDVTGWKIGYVILLVFFSVISLFLVILIIRKRVFNLE